MKQLRQFRSIFFGELLAYFNSPIAYIFIVVFVMLTGVLFMANFFLIGIADMRYFFDLLPIILCVFIPAITMRIWAEERKGNTFELLLTFPMDSYKIVLGKFAAGFIFYATALLGTVFIPLMLVFTGKPDIGPIIGGYLGACFVGAFFLSVGIFVSGLCKDQIIAFIVSMVACFFFFLSGLDFIASTIDGWIPGLGIFFKTNFGMTRHFLGFEKGVIDLRDILYFIVMTSAFLVLNIFSIEDRMRPKAKMFFAATAGICMVISVLLNSLVFDIPMGRFDLTQGKIYTITQATKDILKELKAPVTVKLYISPPDKMPTAFKTLEQDVKDQLEELKVISNGKFNYKTFHMQVAEEAQRKDLQKPEDHLQKKGIQPFQVKSIEQDEMGIKLVYSALSIAYKEKQEEIIPQITPRDLHNLEYEIMSRVYRMTLDKKPTVALVAPYTEKAIDPKVLGLFRQLGQVPSQYRDDKYRLLEALLKYDEYGINRIRLTKDEPIPEGTNTLIVVDPQDLNERQRYEIDKFLYGGGNVVMAAQGYMYDYRPSRRGVEIIPGKNTTNVNELLENYGVTISDKLLMDNNDEVLTITGGMGLGPFSVSVPVKAPMQIMVNQDDMNQDISITSRLSSIFYPWGSSLVINKDKISHIGLKETVLFTSSKESWEVKYTGRPLGPQDVEDITSFEGKKPLAVMLEGQFPDVFSGRPVPAWPEPNTEQAAQSNQDKAYNPQGEVTAHAGKLILVGCSTMFQEDFIKNGGAMDFFMNSVDAVTLGDQLIKIRSHQPVNRQIKKLSNVEKLWYRFLTIILVPLIVILFGGIRAVLRKKEKEQYLRLIKGM